VVEVEGGGGSVRSHCATGPAIMLLKIWCESPGGRAIGTVTLVYRQHRGAERAVVLGAGKTRVWRSVI